MGRRSKQTATEGSTAVSARPQRKSAVAAVAAATAATKDTAAERKQARLAVKEQKSKKVTSHTKKATSIVELKRRASHAEFDSAVLKSKLARKSSSSSAASCAEASIRKAESKSHPSMDPDAVSDTEVDSAASSSTEEIGDIPSTSEEELAASDLEELEQVKPVEQPRSKRRHTQVPTDAIQHAVVVAQVDTSLARAPVLPVPPATATSQPRRPRDSMTVGERQLIDAALPWIIRILVSTETGTRDSLTHVEASFWLTKHQIRAMCGILGPTVLGKNFKFDDIQAPVFDYLADKRCAFLTNVQRETTRILIPSLALGTVSNEGKIQTLTTDATLTARNLLDNWRRCLLFWEHPRESGDVANAANFFRSPITTRIAAAIIAETESSTFGGQAIPAARPSDHDGEFWHEERDFFFGVLALAVTAERHVLTEIANRPTKTTFSAERYLSHARTHWRWLRKIEAEVKHSMSLVDYLRDAYNMRRFGRSGTSASSSAPPSDFGGNDVDDDDDPLVF